MKEDLTKKKTEAINIINKGINSKSKRIALDMMINLIGTGFPLFVLQIVIYPIVAKMIPAEVYGQMQSTLSVIYLVGGTLGGALSTTRLIRDYDYQTEKTVGDYNKILAGSAVSTLVLTFVILVFYLPGVSVFEKLLITATAILNLMQNYIEVGFRLKLDYRSIFICKILTCVGYAAGFGLFYLTLKWECIFICSYVVTVTYCILKTGLLKEDFVITKMFKGTMRTFGNLSLAMLLDKALTYFDKLMLYPMLGGEAVSVYFAANIFGKLILQTLEPITNVILSYLSKRGSVSKNVWKITSVVGGAFCIVVYFVCLLICKPILGIFYPQWLEAAVPLIPIATASLCVSSFISIIYPLALKTIDSNRQVIINAISVSVYILFIMILYRSYGLKGCCYALLISYVTRLLAIVFFCTRKSARVADQ